jgi:hypothetical protein
LPDTQPRRKADRRFTIGELLAFTAFLAFLLSFWHLSRQHGVATFPALVVIGIYLCGPIGLAVGGRKCFFVAMVVAGGVLYLIALVWVIVVLAIIF